MYILLRYPHLVDYNSKNAELLNSIDDRSQFFVIKSFSEEDVHKSIKYGLWTSTKSGNYTLNNSFRITAQNGGYVYLFFSTNGSGRFVGLARMKSQVNFDDSFSYWTQDNKWTGVFQIDWLFIKDTPFKMFRNICIMMKDGQRKPVCNSRDTQEVPFDDACKMIEIIQNYKNTNTILEHFEYYDIRQENYEKHLNSNKLLN
jgi:YTH domain-containing family protein